MGKQKPNLFLAPGVLTELPDHPHNVNHGVVWWEGECDKCKSVLLYGLNSLGIPDKVNGEVEEETGKMYALLCGRCLRIKNGG